MVVLRTLGRAVLSPAIGVMTGVAVLGLFLLVAAVCIGATITGCIGGATSSLVAALPFKNG